MAKKKGKKKKASLNAHTFRLTAVTDVVTDGAGTQEPGSVCYFFKDHDIAKTVIQQSNNTAIFGLSNVTELEKLYDQYRVKSCRVRYSPKYDKGSYVAIASGNLQGQPTAYISHDIDNVAVRLPKSELVQRQKTKRFDMSRKFTYRWRPTRVSTTAAGGGRTHISRGGWINLQDAYPIEGEVQMISDPWETAGPQSGPTALTNAKVGELLVEYIVEFRARR